MKTDRKFVPIIRQYDAETQAPKPEESIKWKRRARDGYDTAESDWQTERRPDWEWSGAAYRDW